MDSALRIKGLRKSYRGRVALDGLNLNIPQGAIAAIVGANGAGKTTTFSLIGGYFKSDAGSIDVQGLPLKKYRSMGGVIGMLPQDVLLFETRSVKRQLLLFAHLQGFWGSGARAEVQRVLGLVGLLERERDNVSALSHGMKVRLGVAQALIGTPPLVILDEPTAGLDPQMVANFRSMVRSLKGSTTLLISSHDLSELEQVCDYLCIIDHGKLVKEGPLGEVLTKKPRVLVRVNRDTIPNDTVPIQEMSDALPEFKFHEKSPGVFIVESEQASVSVSEINLKVLGWLMSHGIGVLEVHSQRSLEEAYLDEVSKD